MLVINFDNFAIVSDNQIIYNIMGGKSVIVTDKVNNAIQISIFFHLQLIVAADNYIICNFNANKVISYNKTIIPCFSLNMNIMRPTACLHLSFTKFQMSLRDMNLTI